MSNPCWICGLIPVQGPVRVWEASTFSCGVSVCGPCSEPFTHQAEIADSKTFLFDAGDCLKFAVAKRMLQLQHDLHASA